MVKLGLKFRESLLASLQVSSHRAHLALTFLQNCKIVIFVTILFRHTPVEQFKELWNEQVADFLVEMLHLFEILHLLIETFNFAFIVVDFLLLHCSQLLTYILVLILLSRGLFKYEIAKHLHTVLLLNRLSLENLRYFSQSLGHQINILMELLDLFCLIHQLLHNFLKLISSALGLTLKI